MSRAVVAPARLAWLHRPPLAWRNVLGSPRRTAVAVVGMGFAVVMVLLQLGFLHAVELTARVPYDPLAFDVLLVSPQFDQFYDPGAFPRARLAQAAAIETVVAARPLWARMDLWRCPTPTPQPPPPRAVGGGARTTTPYPDAASGPAVPIHWRALLVIGIDLSDNPYVGPIRDAIDAHAARLRVPGRVLMDELSNPDFGWSQVGDFQGWELAGHRAVVVGGFRLGRSFGADAAVLGSEQTFARGLASVVRPGVSDSASLVNLGLLQIRPGTLAETLDALRRRLPPDVQVLSRSEVYRLESRYWVQRTATGMIFSFGVGVTMLVAAVVVYQVLSNDVRNRLPEYATLKAMGYTDAGLAGIVVAQAAIYALLAFVPAALVSIVTYALTERLAHIPMVLTFRNLALVLGLTLVAGLASGALSLGRLRRANPADLY